MKDKLKDCPKCNGKGGWFNHNGHGIEQCAHCNGTGKKVIGYSEIPPKIITEDCFTCDGTGRIKDKDNE